MSERQETGISGVDSCSEYVENRGLLGGFSLLSSETEDMGSRAVFESTLLTEPIGADKISPFRSFPSLSSIHSLSPGSSKFIPQPKHSTRLPKTSTPVPETSTPVPKTSTSVSKTSTPVPKTLSVSSSILHPTYQKILLPLNIANNNKKRGRKLMTKKNVGSIKLMNCQVTLRRMRSENYSEHLMTDQSEGNTQNGVIVEALNDGSIVESKRKRSKVSLNSTFMAGHSNVQVFIL
ncbi:uncharacterized protein LOC111698668 [Eurytemora carolleeae]|uniref:uncharacterized protein LOC111698668 n=1 Tax=Eurytemora carolleeae TaxID=1294199 RepID=UPI000C77CDD9|nr:uncharacterized protein LOC111698668 [Eurytemora carolleeae]|eukprot:XP_023324835.1 uncharacterized protein LOC111698668 [Eurytemora affinis]